MRINPILRTDSYKASHFLQYPPSTEAELLSLLKQYYNDYKKVPSLTDFSKNPKYPSPETYRNHFGSWSNAMKLADLDVDTVVKEGKIPSSYHKGRVAELLVFNSFKDKNNAIDLSGVNCNSIFDGMCPRGRSYDVKSAALTYNKKYPSSGGWGFHFRNKEIEQIEYFYCVAVDEEYKILRYVWLIPREDLRNVKDTLYVSLSRIHNYDKYLVDFTKCNLDLLKKNEEEVDESNKNKINTDKIVQENGDDNKNETDKENVKQENRKEFKRKIFTIRAKKNGV